MLTLAFLSGLGGDHILVTMGRRLQTSQLICHDCRSEHGCFYMCVHTNCHRLWLWCQPGLIAKR